MVTLSEEVRAFLEQPRLCVLATINADGSPQLTVMWYDFVDDLVVLNTTRGLVKERNLRRDPRVAVCVEDEGRYVTLSGQAELVEDRAVQEAEVARMATRYNGPRRGATHWQTIAHQDRLGIRVHVQRVQTRGFA
ncbi:MAG TPA: PPOX class F420-dependent oxidoreductase [Chloroflexota bacterium]|nr:PPOX class F420-dependent oxidoreductase [Chloroflexota bacterium]